MGGSNTKPDILIVSCSESERDTSELFKTAEVEDAELSLMVTDSNSGAAWGFTLPTLGKLLTAGQLEASPSLP